MTGNEQEIFVYMLNMMRWTLKSVDTFYEYQLNNVSKLLTVVQSFDNQSFFDKWSLWLKLNGIWSILVQDPGFYLTINPITVHIFSFSYLLMLLSARVLQKDNLMT